METLNGMQMLHLPLQLSQICNDHHRLKKHCLASHLLLGDYVDRKNIVGVIIVTFLLIDTMATKEVCVKRIYDGI